MSCAAPSWPLLALTRVDVPGLSDWPGANGWNSALKRRWLPWCQPHRDRPATGQESRLVRALYQRSGWTQDELAKVEECSQQQMTRKLLFGRFLAFTPSGSNPRNLTEKRFRSYWEATEKNPNERVGGSCAVLLCAQA